MMFLLFCDCGQAIVYCTPGRAKKVVMALTIVAMTSHAFVTLVQHLSSMDTLRDTEMVYVVVYLVLPLAVLIINLLVVCEVRRASNNASANLGIRQSQQATSSNSAVPTVMLISTSLIYVVISNTWYILQIYAVLFQPSASSGLNHVYIAAGVVQRLIFAYNFFVYLITGTQFRSQLRSLCCCCCCSSVAVAGTDDARVSRRGPSVTSTV